MDLGNKIAYLQEIGCCRLCCLRYLGKKKFEDFRSCEDDTIEEELKERPCKVPKTSPCVAFVGLLQHPTTDSAVKMIIDELNKADYDCKDFSIAISLPRSLQLRTHAMLLHMIDKFPSEGKPEAWFLSVKEVSRIIASGLVAKAVNKTYDSSGNSSLLINVTFDYDDDLEECAPLDKLDPKNFSKAYQEHNSRKPLDPSQYSKEKFKSLFACPPAVPKKMVTCSSVTASHASVFVAGRYRKHQRGLSQTPWLINGERREENETSVQELLCDRIVKLLRADDMRFSSSGREDVDVRMLGRGRPFACELINPRQVNITAAMFRSLEEDLMREQCGVTAHLLQIVDKESIKELKKGEEEKLKTYCAYCVVNRGTPNWDLLNEICASCPITLQQRTPIRVVHRRSLATRPRTIHWMKIDKPETNEPRAFIARFCTQAGTYVKEFVHGDLGRTKPNLCQLLGEDVDILALDVENVEIDWPPELE